MESSLIFKISKTLTDTIPLSFGEKRNFHTYLSAVLRLSLAQLEDFEANKSRGLGNSICYQPIF